MTTVDMTRISKEEDNIKVVKKAFSLMASGKLEEFYELFSDDCEVTQAASLPFGGVYRGKDAIRFAFARIMETWEKVETHKLKYFCSGEDVIVHMVAGGVGPFTGKSFWMDILELWRVRDGKVVEMKPFFFDTARLVEAL